MGWNLVNMAKASTIFDASAAEERFYLVHSWIDCTQTGHGFVLEKLGFTHDEFGKIIRQSPVPHSSFDSDQAIETTLVRIRKALLHWLLIFRELPLPRTQNYNIFLKSSFFAWISVAGKVHFTFAITLSELASG